MGSPTFFAGKSPFRLIGTNLRPRQRSRRPILAVFRCLHAESSRAEGWSPSSNPCCRGFSRFRCWPPRFQELWNPTAVYNRVTLMECVRSSAQTRSGLSAVENNERLATPEGTTLSGMGGTSEADGRLDRCRLWPRPPHKSTSGISCVAASKHGRWRRRALHPIYFCMRASVGSCATPGALRLPNGRPGGRRLQSAYLGDNEARELIAAAPRLNARRPMPLQPDHIPMRRR